MTACCGISASVPGPFVDPCTTEMLCNFDVLEFVPFSETNWLLLVKNEV